MLLPEKLRSLPKADKLENTVRNILREKTGEVVSVVLFGSMVKDEWTIYSDFDLMVVVSRNGRRIIDRMLEYSVYVEGPVDLFVYSVDEVLKMFEDFNLLVLDCLKDGVVLYDNGFWEGLRRRLKELVESGVLTPERRGWAVKIT
ncbi:MAG: nucleotidyltransferase domain-containing protein [Candidatus Caldarchaeum sp.]|nr:nucleotidyltransferase domain-containing protein [Candidatus Caldarchaeum sp.]MDW8435373.1 nucleotidyltransferase domain-containing protein [Candidatus Caldarchaeum sp.]